jgi:hypothetical protein
VRDSLDAFPFAPQTLSPGGLILSGLSLTGGPPPLPPRSGFNLFDCAIVILTSVEIPAATTGALCRLRAAGLSECSDGGSGLSVLRLFRLLRLVRLLRQFPDVQKQAPPPARPPPPPAARRSGDSVLPTAPKA